MAWEDSLGVELQDEWLQLKSRISALIEDLQQIAKGEMPYSGNTADHTVNNWFPIENRNLIEFSNRVGLIGTLGLFEGFAASKELANIQRLMNSEREAARRAMLAGTGQEISPEVEDPPDEEPSGPSLTDQFLDWLKSQFPTLDPSTSIALLLAGFVVIVLMVR